VGPDANNEGLPDLEAAERIEEMIEGLGFMCKFSFIFTPEATETFYQGGPQKSMSKEEPIDSSKYESRWPEFIDFMASGPTTAIILYSPDGDAVPKWRDHLGHWNIDEVRDMNTIRGKFGVNKYNNLVHGSDAPENIFNELEIIKSCVKTSE
jgi:nucleoside diphosphate kinase